MLGVGCWMWDVGCWVWGVVCETEERRSKAEI